MSYTYLTTEGLAEKIHYEPTTIRNSLKDSVLFEGVHYIRPFGGRKILYIWENVERDMVSESTLDVISIPLASGSICHG
jgi:hypothetical protein